MDILKTGWTNFRFFSSCLLRRLRFIEIGGFDCLIFVEFFIRFCWMDYYVQETSSPYVQAL